MLTVDYERLGVRPGDRLLDLGCGGGRHAFEAFRRGPDAGGNGLGLGLYIVKQIVDAHGGTIAVRSTQAEGTTFSVLWPAS